MTLNTTLKDYQKVAGKMDGALEESQQALKDVRLLVTNVGAKIESLAAETKGALGDARNLIQGTRQGNHPAGGRPEENPGRSRRGLG